MDKLQEETRALSLLLSFIVVCFGSTACGDDDDCCGMDLDYSELQLEGVVVTMQGIPIEDIAIAVNGCDLNNEVFSDTNGQFQYSSSECLPMFTDDGVMTLYVDDVAESGHSGLYNETIMTVPITQTETGDGEYYHGSYSATGIVVHMEQAN